MRSLHAASRGFPPPLSWTALAAAFLLPLLWTDRGRPGLVFAAAVFGGLYVGRFE
jgi:hypothetical protein